MFPSFLIKQSDFGFRSLQGRREIVLANFLNSQFFSSIMRPSVGDGLGTTWKCT